MKDPYKTRFHLLREQLKAKDLDAFIVHRTDEYLNEYVQSSDERICFLSGFTGSFGIMVLTKDKAALFTDSRYLLQAKNQTVDNFSSKKLEILDTAKTAPAEWLGKIFSESKHKEDGESYRVGYNPMLISVLGKRKLEEALKKTDETAIELAAVPEMIIDDIWEDQKHRTFNNVYPYGEIFSGMSCAVKRARIAKKLQEQKAAAAIISDPVSVAWLMNVRGSDIPYTPVPLSRAVLWQDGSADWFLGCTEEQIEIVPEAGASIVNKEARELDKKEGIRDADIGSKFHKWLESMKGFFISSKNSSAIEQFLKHLGDKVFVHFGINSFEKFKQEFINVLNEKTNPKEIILTDGSKTVYAVSEMLKSLGLKAVLGDDVCGAFMAAKNHTEQEHAANIAKKDSIAIVKFLAWLDNTVVQDGQKVSETDAQKALDMFRAEAGTTGYIYRNPSFEPISGAGANAAIAHYDAAKNHETKFLNKGEMYLIDSGAQYFGGTTDITRTTALWSDEREVSVELLEEMKDRYTRVLKGHIALASMKFPSGTRGSELEVFARQPLWQIGEDYGHGTGHGLGSFLCVHEGKYGFSKNSKEPLKEGMLITNEPGFYKEGAYGIRLENMMLVREQKFASQNMLKFEVVSLVPFDKRLFDYSLLTLEEIEWIKLYHLKIYQELSAYLDEETKAWLEEFISED
ncbi:MAG: aminopeptidase P family protein [Alphaproteobacteria bacterium]|nr:aminopeptidase P family protein [Alphaproteobacteria bacterium]MCL2505267.1 aminopeptidase P family protein [Alphaproteobacteria bacterium]